MVCFETFFSHVIGVFHAFEFSTSNLKSCTHKLRFNWYQRSDYFSCRWLMFTYRSFNYLKITKKEYVSFVLSPRSRQIKLDNFSPSLSHSLSWSKFEHDKLFALQTLPNTKSTRKIATQKTNQNEARQQEEYTEWNRIKTHTENNFFTLKEERMEAAIEKTHRTLKIIGVHAYDRI